MGIPYWREAKTVACPDPHNGLATLASDSESSRRGDQWRDLAHK